MTAADFAYRRAVYEEYRDRRSVMLDGLRGLAIVLMILDHLAMLLPFGEVYRLTGGRLAAPIFFLVSGHLFHRLRWRHAAVLLIGLALPVYALWLDVPNVLVVYVLGCLWLRFADWRKHPAWIALAIALTASANGLVLAPNGFEPLALIGLMFLGRLISRDELTGLVAWAPAPLGAALALIGRRPLTWYVGHVLVLTAVVSAFTVWPSP